MREDNPAKAPVKKAAARTGPKIPKKITERYLYNSALAYLQRFPSSVAHFKGVMGRKIDRSCRHHTEQDRAACAALLDKVTAQFIDLGYLNDELYLRGMINSLRSRGLSARAIQMKLAQKGLAADDIKDTLSTHDEEHESNDLTAAQRLCRRKRIGPYSAATPDAPQRQKWLASLARAGFSYDIAVKALEDNTEL